jgi:hypothetical protein
MEGDSEARLFRMESSHLRFAVGMRQMSIRSPQPHGHDRIAHL